MKHIRAAGAALALGLICCTGQPSALAAEDAIGSTFKPEEVEQLVAPIALYPDSLVAQVLMASTYPLEVVEAARWSEANPGLEDDALEEAMAKQPWDASVKSLTAFPQVLNQLSARSTNDSK